MSHQPSNATPFYGLMAEFESAQALLDAAHKVRAAGYTRTDAYSPFPIHGLAEALGFKERWSRKFVLAGGITGRSPATACSTGRRSSPTRSTSAAGPSLVGVVHSAGVRDVRFCSPRSPP